MPAGTQAYKRDVPNAVVQLLDTGHFALETHTDEIAGATSSFLDRAFKETGQGARQASGR